MAWPRRLRSNFQMPLFPIWAGSFDFPASQDVRIQNRSPRDRGLLLSCGRRDMSRRQSSDISPHSKFCGAASFRLRRRDTAFAAERQVAPTSTLRRLRHRRHILRRVVVRLLRRIHRLGHGLSRSHGLRRGSGTGGLKSHPLGFDQILEELGNRPTAFERELIGEGSDFGMDGQVHLPAELTVGIGFSWHTLQCGKILMAVQ